MLFNSIDFAIFLPVVFFLYWFVFRRSLRMQNLFVVAASYLFYGWWDWRFLILIIISTLTDYWVGLALKKAQDNDLTRRRLLLGSSFFVNLGMLGFFKYYNFFLDNFVTAFSFFGAEIQAQGLNIVLPVGISFYTFQTLSYTIDLYRKKIEPTRDLVAFAAFVSFFPQLVAGPIERASNLLPQFFKPRTFEYSKAVDGLRQILWGLFMKVVIADNCAVMADRIFAAPHEYNGSAILLGSLFFAFQIYGDFAGYSNIAIGTARLFGFHLMQNFAFPYFSRDIAEFWRRWHISLSTWFRDYLYIPLGGSRVGTGMAIRNIFIIFVVSGFWHGANWTFIVWGALNAIYFLPLFVLNRNRDHIEIVAKGKWLPSINDAIKILITFGITLIAWIFFRAESVPHALLMINEIFSPTLFEHPGFRFYTLGTLLTFFMIIEWMGREWQYAIERFGFGWPKLLRRGFYFLLVMSIFLLGGKEQEFIYFQF